MGRRIKKYKKALKALDAHHRALWRYREQYNELPLDNTVVLIEPQQGRSLNGNMFYILRELIQNHSYSYLNITLSIKESAEKEIKALLKYHGFLERCRIVIIGTSEYIITLASAKYLVTDTAFPTYYVKKEGQIVWNTWHGTPLKAMGRSDLGDCHRLGNIQRNFIFSDYLSFPNKYTAKHMIDDYMLENICNAKVLMGGYPRNDAFFSDALCEQVREHYGATGKRLYAYMPTWRSYQNELPRHLRGVELESILLQLDMRLSDDELMLVSLHPLARDQIDFENYMHIETFNSNFETYEILNTCDVLVTDYSSVLFDFAVSRKKIILFTYDDDLYLEDRGFYLTFDSLPFSKVKTVGALVKELRTGKDYDDAAFVNKFCSIENGTSTETLCQTIFLGDDKVKTNYIPHNKKENVLIYAGNLAANGITTSLLNLLQMTDAEKYNFFITFDSARVTKNKEVIARLPKHVAYLPCMGKNSLTLFEKIIQRRYSLRSIDFETFDKNLSEAYKFNIKRLYSDIDFKSVIQFNGYDYKKIYLFSLFDANRTIYVHSDMLQEAELKGNARLDILKYAYQRYDNVAIVSDGLRNSTLKIAQQKANIVVAPNVFNYKRIQKMAELPVEFSEKTQSNQDIETILQFLDSGKAIVSIGRFSPEKQHKLLIDAFDSLCFENDLYLIIIGGGSTVDLYRDTCEYLSSKKCSNRVALIKDMENPYSVLTRCKGLILSSKYEGFGVVLMEADVLGIPVVSTDIDGPRAFMNSNGGILIKNSFEGILNGLQLLCEGAVPKMHVDYQQYNDCALKKFQLLLKSTN